MTAQSRTGMVATLALALLLLPLPVQGQSDSSDPQTSQTRPPSDGALDRIREALAAQEVSTLRGAVPRFYSDALLRPRFEIDMDVDAAPAPTVAGASGIDLLQLTTKAIGRLRAAQRERQVRAIRAQIQRELRTLEER